MAFVDCEKAFDSVETNSVIEALQEYRININYIILIRDIYTDNYITICLHKHSNNKDKVGGPTRRHQVIKVIYSLFREHL